MRAISAIILISIILCGACAAADNLDPARALAEISSLTVLSVVTESGDEPTGEDGFGYMTIFSKTGGAIGAERVRVEINERGNTSRRFPKKSFRVKILDERGDKRNYSIAGLRSDDDWILNPMYTDTSKIREALAYRLWAEINSSGARANSTRLAYVEVYVNGDYRGLYALQERVDRKQVEGDKRADVLYKVIANERPSVDELLECKSREECGGFELAFCGSYVTEPWLPAAMYMAYLNGERRDFNARISVENTIDYGLWAMLTQAHDCHFKNQFVNCVYTDDGYVIYRLPWDLNNTFGDVWRNSAEDTNHTGYSVGDLVMDGGFAILLEGGDAEICAQIQARWRELRAGAITEANIISMAHGIYDPLYDAILRDSERWPHGGMGEGNARNIIDIEQYVREILPRMDAFIDDLAR